MNNDQVREDLEAALSSLRRRGWCQGRYVDMKGRVCAVGAVRDAVYGVPRQTQGGGLVREAYAYAALLDKIHDITGVAASVEVYNDHEGITLRDVENLFEKAIADL